MYAFPVAPEAIIPAQVPADRMAQHERNRVRGAILQAKRRYPGPVGDTLARSMEDWLEFGFRYERGDLKDQLVRHLMAEPLR